MAAGSVTSPSTYDLFPDRRLWLSTAGQKLAERIGLCLH